jgi:hypothetical protein
MTEFVGFPKLARLNREIIITEKADGTNAQVVVNDTGDDLLACSRNRFITPEDDNHGFAKWVQENKTELLRLGPGRHYGEWWGSGIQRGYGLTKGEKRWSLFNVSRWGNKFMRPECCGVVPTLYQGVFNFDEINEVIADLVKNGSRLSPGFMRPEGIVVFHTAGGHLYKWTFDGDGVEHKKNKTSHDYLPGEVASA